MYIRLKSKITNPIIMCLLVYINFVFYNCDTQQVSSKHCHQWLMEWWWRNCIPCVCVNLICLYVSLSNFKWRSWLNLAACWVQCKEYNKIIFQAKYEWYKICHNVCEYYKLIMRVNYTNRSFNELHISGMHCQLISSELNCTVGQMS